MNIEYCETYGNVLYTVWSLPKILNVLILTHFVTVAYDKLFKYYLASERVILEISSSVYGTFSQIIGGCLVSSLNIAHAFRGVWYVIFRWISFLEFGM